MGESGVSLSDNLYEAYGLLERYRWPTENFQWRHAADSANARDR